MSVERLLHQLAKLDPWLIARVYCMIYIGLLAPTDNDKHTCDSKRIKMEEAVDECKVEPLVKEQRDDNRELANHATLEPSPAADMRTQHEQDGSGTLGEKLNDDDIEQKMGDEDEEKDEGGNFNVEKNDNYEDDEDEEGKEEDDKLTEEEEEKLRQQWEELENEEMDEEDEEDDYQIGVKVQNQLGNKLEGEEAHGADLQTQRTQADAKEANTVTNERYVFQLSEREKANKLFQLQFNVASNKYVRVSDGDWEIDGWETAVYESNNMFRKEEPDWQMVYLSRQDEPSEGTSKGSIEWRFDFSNDTGLVADHVRIKATSKTFHNGKVSWSIRCAFPGSSEPDINVLFPSEAGKHAMDIPNLKGCNAFILQADLSGGKGDVEWQHAQLFRTGLHDYSGQQLEITIHLTDEMWQIEKVLHGKYFNGKLHYLVKWKNYPQSANTWEPEKHLNSTMLRHLETNPVRITGKPKGKPKKKK